MHHRGHIDGFPFDGIDHALGEPLEKIPPEAPFQDAPDRRMALNVLERCFYCVKEFLSKSITAIFVKQCGVADFPLRRQVETKSQRPSSLRIACNAFAAGTVFAPLRFQAANRFSASATQASSTAVSGSSCISTSNRSANRSRSIAESLRACFSRANARVVISILRGETTLDNGNCTRSHTYPQRHERPPIRQNAPSPIQWRQLIVTPAPSYLTIKPGLAQRHAQNKM